MRYKTASTKLDIAVILLSLPYIYTLIWALGGVILYSYPILSIENYEFVGKNPVLFMLSSLTVISGIIMLIFGYKEVNKVEKIYKIPTVLLIIVIFNLSMSSIIGSIVTGNIIEGFSLLNSCYFIPMYNFLILLIGIMMVIRSNVKLYEFVVKKAGELLLMTILCLFIIIRIIYGPNFYLMVISLAVVFMILYIFFIRR